MYSIIHFVFSLIAVAIFVFFVSHLFLIRDTRSLPYRGLLLVVGIGLLLVEYQSGGREWYMVVLTCLFQLLLMMILFQGSLLRKMAVLLFYRVMDTGIRMAVLFLLSQMTRLDLGYFLTMDGPSHIPYMLGCRLTLFLVLFLICHFFYGKSNFGKSNSYPSIHSAISLLLFGSNYLLMLFLFQTVRIMGRGAGMLILLSVFYFLISIIVFLLLEQLQRQADQTIQNHLLRLQLKEEKKLLTQYQEQEKEQKILRHDFNHYLLNYLELLKSGKTEAVIQDMEGLLNRNQAVSGKIFTTNLLFQALLSHIEAECQKSSIAFQAAVSIPEDIEDLELASAIMNLLDNAYEKELSLPMEKRRIQFEATAPRNELSILIRNRIAESVLRTNPELVSSKADAADHGIGLSSVRCFLQKRNGMIDFFEEKEEFCVHFVLPL